MTGHGHPHDVSVPGQHRHTADGGPIVLDVGDDVGALVLRTTADARGLEIEISPVQEPGRRRHVAVHPRFLEDRTVYAAVYPELLAGDYQLWSPHGEPVLAVTVAGGRVTEADWPG